ncbi:hypothetical protein GCM10009802_43450 [Streptomyces synnematoformans]|uniref:Uncharacterized protein n=1 Tax=Streptomyces synnematoformans TaxID=415721 RepID=A0ABP5KMT8_9ACTN
MGAVGEWFRPADGPGVRVMGVEWGTARVRPRAWARGGVALRVARRGLGAQPPGSGSVRRTARVSVSWA